MLNRRQLLRNALLLAGGLAGAPALAGNERSYRLGPFASLAKQGKKMDLPKPEVVAFQSTATTARQRLRTAAAAIPLGAAQGSKLGSWLDQVPTPDKMPGGTAALLGATLAADLNELAMLAIGETAPMLASMQKFFAKIGVPPATTAKFSATVATLGANALGFGFAVHDHGMDITWQIPGPQPLGRALDVAEPGAPVEQFRAWAKAHKIDEVRVVSRSLASTSTRIEVQLPGKGATAVLAGEDLFTALKIGQLPANVLQVLRKLEQPLALTLRLGQIEKPGDAGVADVGFVVQQPATAVVVQMLSLAGLKNDAQIANFEGFLQVPGSAQMTVRALSGKPQIDLQYHAGADAKVV